MHIRKAIEMKRGEIAKAQKDLKGLEHAAEVLGLGTRGRWDARLDGRRLSRGCCHSRA